MLADLAGLERRVEAWRKRARGGDGAARGMLAAAEPALALLAAGRPAREAADAAAAHPAAWRDLRLLTAKPVLYACNVDEDSAAAGQRRVAPGGRDGGGARGGACRRLRRHRGRDRRAGRFRRARRIPSPGWGWRRPVWRA